MSLVTLIMVALLINVCEQCKGNIAENFVRKKGRRVEKEIIMFPLFQNRNWA